MWYTDKEPQSHPFVPGENWMILEEDGPVCYPGVTPLMYGKSPLWSKEKWEEEREKWEEFYQDKKTYAYQGTVNVSAPHVYWASVELRMGTGRVCYPEAFSTVEEARRWMKDVFRRLKLGHHDCCGSMKHALSGKGYTTIYGQFTTSNTKKADWRWMGIDNWWSEKGSYEGYLFFFCKEKMQVELHGPWDELVKVYPVARKCFLFSDFSEKETWYWKMPCATMQTSEDMASSFLQGFEVSLDTFTEKCLGRSVQAWFTAKNCPYLWELQYTLPVQNHLSGGMAREPRTCCFSVVGEVWETIPAFWQDVFLQENTRAEQRKRNHAFKTMV